MTLTNAMITQIVQVVLMVAAFIPAIVIHEVAHGYAAYKLGDTTAKRAGRLTLNPLKHVDPFGTVILPGCLILMSALSGGSGMIFGYAKPVPYDPGHFKNIRKGELIVGLAGPASNLAMSLIGAAIAWGGVALLQGVPTVPMLGIDVWYFGTYFTMINLCLAFFNLIPIPPLDGSSIIAVFLSNKALITYYKIQRYAMFFFLLVVLVLPYYTGINIFGWYLNLTAGNIADLLLPI